MVSQRPWKKHRLGVGSIERVGIDNAPFKTDTIFEANL
jgi:hypothetical protein